VPARRIGEILVAEGVLTDAAVDRALGFQRVTGECIKLGTILLNWDLLAEDALLRALAHHHHVAAAPWSALSAAPIEVTRVIPAATAIRLGAFPYAATRTSVHVAFLDPSNLGSQDEIAAVADRRVIPAIALEIRLLQAHQKFYGRHIPIEYRSIAQKLQRRTAKEKLPGAPSAGVERTAASRRPAPPPPRSIPVRRDLLDHDLVPDEMPRIEVPEMPVPAPPPRALASRADPLSNMRPITPSSDRLSDTHPVRRATQSERLGGTRSGRHGAPPTAARPERTSDGDDTLPRGAAAHLPPNDVVAGMWRPTGGQDSGDDSSVSRMWAPTAAEIEASLGEARTRGQIGHVALETLLSDMPRVLLLGCGKTAITGWQGRGEDLTPDSIAGIRIPLEESKVFAVVRATGVPHFGPLEGTQWPQALAERLGEKAPDCAVFPIRILEGTAAFLYADRLGAPLHYEDFAVVARAAAATANALARFLLRRSHPAPAV